VIGYPVVPVLFVFVAVALLYSTLRSSPRESGIGLAIIAAGLPFYFHWKRQVMSGGSSQRTAETAVSHDPPN
jgi:basic amino acid/polyamine antiporter, APA family